MSRYDEWKRERARLAPLARRLRAAWHGFFHWENHAKSLIVDAMDRLDRADDEAERAGRRFARNRYRRAKR